jgi:hypothetical protein
MPATTAQSKIIDQISSLDKQIENKEGDLSSLGFARQQTQSLSSSSSNRSSIDRTFSSNINNENFALQDLREQRESLRQKLIQSYGGDANKADTEINNSKFISKVLDGVVKKSPTKGRAKTSSPSFLNERRKNFNIIGFDVAQFLDSMITEINHNRVGSESLLSQSIHLPESEPRINTFYRMMGFPSSGTKGSDGRFKDIVSSVTSKRQAELQDIINRGVPGDSKSRFLYPVVDNAISIPNSSKIENPFINTIIAIRLNKYDVDVKPSGKKDSNELQQIEQMLKKNINSLINTFPRFLLRKVQQDAKFRTLSHKRNNNDLNSSDGQSKANNGSFTINAVDASGAALSIELKTSQLEQISQAICDELEVEGQILSLLPIVEIRRNVFSGPLMTMINHNTSFLNNTLEQLVDISERLLTASRKREYDISLLEGVNLSFLPDLKSLSTTIKNKLSYSISAVEIVAVLAALFEIPEEDLLTIAVNNGISSSQELAAAQILISNTSNQINKSSSQSDTEVREDNLSTLLKFLSDEQRASSLDALDKLIKEKLTDFNKTLEDARKSVRDKELGKTIQEISKSISSSNIVISTSSSGAEQNPDQTRQNKC